MELIYAMKILKGGLPTAIQKVDYPIHKGLPNPKHGKYYFRGHIPVDCVGKYYDTEAEAIQAAFDAGIEKLQGVDCRWITGVQTCI